MSTIPNSSLRLLAGNALTPIIRAIVYSTRLSWGAKCLGIAFLDTPATSSPTNAALARKLHSSPSQVSIWRSELSRNNISIRISPKERRLEAREILG